MKQLTVVTLDGPAGAGKSTVARRLAHALNFRFLDTGAMYRCVTLAARKRGLAPREGENLNVLLEDLRITFLEGDRVLINDEDVTEAIRSAEVTAAVSAFAALESVRSALTDTQRRMGEEGRLVCEGRDMGSVVFPDAALRIYLDASAEVRCERRALELEAKGQEVDRVQLLEEIQARDAADSSRAVAPLKRLPDMHYVDSSHLGQDEVVQLLIELAHRELAEAPGGS